MNLANGAAQVGNEEIIMSTRVSFGPQAVGVLKKFPCLNGRPHRLPHAIEKSGTGSVSLEDKVYMRNSKISDRKSTRLNSSHVSISYAVFCLKKKKKKYRK